MSKNSRKILITVTLVFVVLGIVGLATDTLSWKGLLFAAAFGCTFWRLPSRREGMRDGMAEEEQP